jgi:hypothetical protein
VKLTTHLQRVSRLRKRGSIHPLPHTSPWRSAQLAKRRDNSSLTARDDYKSRLFESKVFIVVWGPDFVSNNKVWGELHNEKSRDGKVVI